MNTFLLLSLFSFEPFLMETATLGHNLFCLKDLALTPRTHILLSLPALAIKNILLD